MTLSVRVFMFSGIPLEENTNQVARSQSVLWYQFDVLCIVKSGVFIQNEICGFGSYTALNVMHSSSSMATVASILKNHTCCKKSFFLLLGHFHWLDVALLFALCQFHYLCTIQCQCTVINNNIRLI